MNNNNTIPSWWFQSSFKKFKQLYLEEEKTLFFIGSGLSRWKGLPDWTGLLLSIASSIEKNSHKQQGLYNQIKNILHQDDNDLRHQEAGSILKKASSDELLNWSKIIRQILKSPEPHDKDDIHQMLARLRCHGIITTNFDSLIEQGHHSTHQKIKVMYPNHEDIESLEVMRDKFLFKIHGDIEDEDSGIILSKEDYESLYGEAENNQMPKDLIQLQTLLRTSTIIFLGYSHNDKYLIKYIKYAMHGRKRDRLFALVPMTGNPRVFEKSLREKEKDLGIQFIVYSQDDGFHEIFDFLHYFTNPSVFDDNYQRLTNINKPTILMLYCGGTIGSTKSLNQPLKIKHKNSRFDKTLNSLSDQILKWHKLPKDPDCNYDDSVDLIWEVLSENDQIFSENVTPNWWNILTDKITEIAFKYFRAKQILFPEFRFNDDRLLEMFEEDRRQFKLTNPDPNYEYTERAFFQDIANRYILGIIILSGTDTLPFTASALSLNLHNMVCPVIITGANNPPDEKEEVGKIKYQNVVKSDSWRNLLASVYFLQVFGHLLTEVFVCFGDTVHFGVNLRKRSTDSTPFIRMITDRSFEPFMYRNLSFQSEYMFKLIDGVFSNNYYPRGEIDWFDMLKMKDFSSLKHIRSEVIPSGNLPLNKAGIFKPCVRFIQVNPCMPEIDVNGMLSNNPNEKIRVLLVEGYASGTYPTIPDHNFSKLLNALYDERIPIVLISLYGIASTQETYETYEIHNKIIPVLPLYGIVSETATPLLSLIVGRITDFIWDSSKTYEDRLNLVKQGIQEHFHSHQSIISKELKSITDKNDLVAKIALNLKPDNVISDQERLNRPVFNEEKIKSANWIINAINPGSANLRLRSLGERRTILILRNDFLFLIEELTALPLEKIGLGPDGFQALNNTGYKIGYSLASKQSKVPYYSWASGLSLYHERAETERENLFDSAAFLILQVIDLLHDCGFAKIDLLNKDNIVEIRNGYIKLSVQITKEDRGYNEVHREVVSYLPENAIFFHKLRSGQFSDEGLKDAYDALLNVIWTSKVRSIDWFVLGIIRGVLASIGGLIRINETAIKAKEEIHSGGEALHNDWYSILRDSTKFRISNGDEKMLLADIILWEQGG